MAGIGFELRKLFRGNSLLSKIRGVLYASATTIGPLLIFLLLLLAVNLCIRFFGLDTADQLFFSSAFQYLFVLAVLVSCTLNTIVSRYTSDMIFEKKEDRICDALYGSVFLSAVGCALFMLPICLLLWLEYGRPLLFLCGYYLLSILAGVTYTIMTFVSTIKEYKRVTFAFGSGILVAVAVYAALFFLAGWPVMESMIYAILAMFFVINLFLLTSVISFFPKGRGKYFAFLRYFAHYPFLFLSGFLYIVGLYTSNLVYWFFSDDISVTVDLFHVAPPYDMAMFLALLVNITGTVIFTIKVETQVYEKYKLYVTAIANASFAVIEKTRKNLMNTVDTQLFFIYEVQLVITTFLSCLGILFFPMLGLGGMVLDFFLLLGLAVYCIFSMYFTIVFLYYFDDQWGAFVSAALFFVVTLVLSFVFLGLGTAYYAVAPVAGAVAGWVFAFVRLKFFLKHINAHLFCRGYLGDPEGEKA